MCLWMALNDPIFREDVCGKYTKKTDLARTVNSVYTSTQSEVTTIKSTM